jgi:hypothetical protein
MYYWSPSFNADMGIQRQMKAKQVLENGVVVWKTPRMGQDLTLVPAPHLVNDGKANTTGVATTINAQRASALNYLKPVWR